MAPPVSRWLPAGGVPWRLLPSPRPVEASWRRGMFGVASLASAVSSGVQTGAVELAEPASLARERTVPEDAAHDWVCIWCRQRVASDKDRWFHQGRSEFVFKNPEGIRFEILTFSRTLGCDNVGVPTLEHTWFLGHAWSYCVCANCRSHLGWYYTGPDTFVGLIRNRILRAAWVSN